MNNFLTKVRDIALIEINLRRPTLDGLDLSVSKTQGIIAGSVLIVTLAAVLATAAPFNFGPQIIIKIEKGESIKEVADKFQKGNLIRSSTLFSTLIQLNKDATVFAGEYLFDEKENIFSVVERVTTGDYGIPLTEVTLTEGLTVEEMAIRLESNFDQFDKEYFIEIATPYEGYLFPDTYKFAVNVKADEVFEVLRETFNKKISVIEDDILASGMSLPEIIIMASIVEKEATADTIQEVTDLLWKRMDINMPLQVDATFVYSIGKGTFDLTLEDLREDHPYNTYENTGLPPTPISNPGIEAIIASVYPQDTESLYFLTGRDGEMYFADDFKGHKRNRALYLD